MRFVSFDEVRQFFNGKTVAVVGSGPSSLDCAAGFVDSHDIVLRVSNYKCGVAQGFRTDVHYSFYGSSIRKTAAELQRDGVKLLMCKCPDAQPIESPWHKKHGKQNGVDFRYIFRQRAAWWFGDVFVPDVPHFMRTFELLGGRIPTTGFAAILDVLACDIKAASIVGFDFMTSGLHNVDEKWKPGDPTDPIGHRPEMELAWIAANVNKYPIACDAKLTQMIQRHRAAA